MSQYYLKAITASGSLYTPCPYTLDAPVAWITPGTGDHTITVPVSNDVMTAVAQAWQTYAAVSAASSSYILAADNAPMVWADASASAATITWTNASAAIYTVSLPMRALTPAEVEAQRVRIAAVREAEDTARARAESLLHRYLCEDQRITLRDHGWFMVVSRTGNRYRVYRGRSHNVKLLDASDREIVTYCAHPQMVVPEADCMLSQKLMLELAEDKFLTMANKRHLMPERKMAAA